MSKQVYFDSSLGRVEVLALYLGVLEKGHVIKEVSYDSLTQRSAEVQPLIQMGHTDWHSL